MTPLPLHPVAELMPRMDPTARAATLALSDPVIAKLKTVRAALAAATSVHTVKGILAVADAAGRVCPPAAARY